MHVERKAEIRSLIRSIPQLIKAQLVNQAFETEKIIAATYNMSDDFIALMGGKVPPNYIEKIQQVYSDLLYKAFNSGYKNGEVKLKTISLNETGAENIDHEIDIKMPMNYGLKKDLKSTFTSEIGKYLETVPSSGETIYVQFGKDLESAYRDGVKEYHSEITEDDEPSEIDSEDEADDTYTEEDIEFEPDFDINDEDADDDLEGLDDIDEPDDGEDERGLIEDEFSEEEEEDEVEIDEDENLEEEEAKMAHSTLKRKPKIQDKDDILADFSSNDILRELEEYTRLPGDAEAEKVLRYELGLPPKNTTTASKRSVIRGGKVVGPYDTQVLKEKILSAVGTHELDTSELQTIIIECLVSDVDKLAEIDTAKAIAQKLGFTEALTSENITLTEVEDKADMIAQSLNVSVGLPGDLVFVEANGDYCLTFNFARADAPKLSRETDATSFAAKSAKSPKNLPGGPQGVLSKYDQREIEALAHLSKSKTMRDLKKASSKVASYVSDILSNMRRGKIGISEGTSKLRANMEDIVAEVFGSDGLGYYQYVKDKTGGKKRA